MLSEAALRRGDPSGATALAERALAEALRSRLPTAWRAHAALADALRAAGEGERAIDHVRRGEIQVAGLLETIDDAVIRDTFAASAAERLSGEGRPG